MRHTNYRAVSGAREMSGGVTIRGAQSSEGYDENRRRRPSASCVAFREDWQCDALSETGRFGFAGTEGRDREVEIGSVYDQCEGQRRGFKLRVNYCRSG